jgi:hypothetical protein
MRLLLNQGTLAWLDLISSVAIQPILSEHEKVYTLLDNQNQVFRCFDVSTFKIRSTIRYFLPDCRN